MKNIYTLSIFTFILILFTIKLNSQNYSSGCEYNRSSSENTLVSHELYANRSLDDLILERQKAYDSEQSTLELDAEIENYLLNQQSLNNGDNNHLKAAPANDNCSNATTITVGNPLLCNQTTQSASLQSSEVLCGTVAGGNAESVWYRFTATNDSAVISFILTNISNCYPFIGVFGPYNNGAGCLPGTGSNKFCQYMGLVDPGFHKLITGLTIGKDYLIYIEGTNCGGPNDRFSKFCIGVASPLSNTTASGATLIDKCGAGFSGNTNIGNYPSGSSSGNNNIDNNSTTTVSGASETGDDVNFVINNDSWFKFCALNTGTYQLNISGISNCTLPTAPNQGIQSAIFIGTPTNLTNIYSFPNPMAMGSNNTSPTFTVNTGECAYILIDGFAGDACNYSVTLSNITGGCKVLPIELISFTAQSYLDQILIKWVTGAEINNDYFTILKSTDGRNYSNLVNINSFGNSNNVNEYSFIDTEPLRKTTYYRLRQTDYDGRFTQSNIISISPRKSELMNSLNAYFESSSQTLNLSFVGKQDVEYNYSVYDVSGRVLTNGTIYSESSEIISNIGLPGINQGMYTVILNDSGTTLRQKFMVTK